MSGSKKRIPRNMARIEFLACREEIETLLSQGYDKRKIHARLIEKKKVSMSYDAFCKVLLNASKNKLNIQTINMPSEPKPIELSPSHPIHLSQSKIATQNSGPRIITSNHEPFPNPRKMAVEDGI